MSTFFRDAESERAARRQLGQFLRMHREALKPEQFGLIRASRRRSPGLLRYEVAQLAAVSDTWYTWLEQGRDIHASASSLDAIARALCLDEHARRYIRYLAGLPVAESEGEESDVADELVDLVHEFTPQSACITTGCYDLLVWNRPFEEVWLTPGHDRPLGNNALWNMLTDPVLRERFEDWESEVAGLVARFRFESAKHPADPRFEELIEAFKWASPEFGELWSRAKVQPVPTGRSRVLHPTEGALTFRRIQLRVIDQPGLMLTVQRAADEHTQAALHRLMATPAGATREHSAA